jgi:hypothetical protein
MLPGMKNNIGGLRAKKYFCLSGALCQSFQKLVYTLCSIIFPSALHYKIQDQICCMNAILELYRDLCDAGSTNNVAIIYA